MSERRLEGRSVVSLALAVMGIVALAVSFAGRADAADAARRAPHGTHVGQDVDDLVVLRLADIATTPKFVRLGADATEESEEFLVPAGRRLVVTDVDYCVTEILSSKSATLRLRLQDTTTSAIVPVYLASAVALDEAISGSGSTKRFAGSTGLFTGFVVAPGTRIVADLVAPASVRQAGTEAYGSTTAEVLVRGYLTNGD